jgi:peptide/nickel transport system permease protein
MARYIARRILVAIALLFVVSAVVFVLFNVFPSADPAALRAGRNASPEQVERVRVELGLDDPVIVQYGRYVRDIFTPFGEGPFYFGKSFQTNQEVREVIFDRLPPTALLVLGGVILWLAIGIPIGIISAVRRRSLLDRTTMITSLAFISAPVFWLGLVSLYLFAQDVGVIPLFPGQAGYQDASSFFGKVYALTLPCLVLATATAAIYARYLRSQMIDVLSEDYIRTARAKGLPEKRVIMKHALRSAITPLVTLLGLDIGTLLAGNAILTESVFNIPGLGKEISNAIRISDLPVIQGITLFGAFFIVIFNLIVDVLYAYLDPRVRY